MNFFIIHPIDPIAIMINLKMYKSDCGEPNIINNLSFLSEIFIPIVKPNATINLFSIFCYQFLDTRQIYYYMK